MSEMWYTVHPAIKCKRAFSDVLSFFIVFLFSFKSSRQNYTERVYGVHVSPNPGLESGLDCGVDKIDEMNLAKLLSSFTCKSSAEDPEQYPNNTHISKFHMAAALFVNNNKLEEAELFLTCPDKLSNLAHNIERIHHGKDTSQNTGTCFILSFTLESDSNSVTYGAKSFLSIMFVSIKIWK